MQKPNKKDRLERADETIFSTHCTQFLFIKYSQEINIKENKQPRKISEEKIKR